MLCGRNAGCRRKRVSLVYRIAEITSFIGALYLTQVTQSVSLLRTDRTQCVSQNSSSHPGTLIAWATTQHRLHPVTYEAPASTLCVACVLLTEHLSDLLSPNFAFNTTVFIWTRDPVIEPSCLSRPSVAVIPVLFRRFRSYRTKVELVP
jgi:hypothetical protein